jgi:FlaA1/EpsC-like NDP-sugar epimerase
MSHTALDRVKTVLRHLPPLRNRAFFGSDALLLCLSILVSFGARFDGVFEPWIISQLQLFTLAVIPLKLVALIWLGMYRRMWRYASVTDLELMVVAAAVCAAIDVVCGGVLMPASGMSAQRVSYAVLLLDSCLGAIAIAAPRLAVRMLGRGDRRVNHSSARRAIVVGAGAAGGMIVREMSGNPQLGLRAVAILDDDPAKHGLRLHNVPVAGALNELAEVARRAQATDVVIAMPSAPGRAIREVLRMASDAGLATRTVPGLYELLSGEKRVNALRQVAIEDLLRREPIQTDVAQVGKLVTGRVVMVTGAGGSIGSELCRQLARQEPERIVAVGRGENSIFELLQELGRTFPQVRTDAIIADVRDYARMERVFAEHRPYSVFHAAAHKHVPLMEANVAEAVLNNVLGTQNVVALSSQYGVEHFVLISSDKAVRPTSVMGATKRIAEHVVHRHALKSKHSYVAVRFGNVLGSRGSVVPTFMRQIADGGPVTITHPDMTRYFMTIPEAVQLVLQAAAIGRHGEVFVLDMGDPVRVSDLANDLIRLSGLEPNVDIEVRCTGMRPGEKLFEELFFQGTDISPTVHPKILRARDAEGSRHSASDVEALISAARDGRSPAKIRRLMLKIVPEYAGAIEVGDLTIGDAITSRRQAARMADQRGEAAEVEVEILRAEGGESRRPKRPTLERAASDH